MEKFEVEGLKELEEALFALDKHTARKSLARRVLKKNGKPLADRMNETAPDDPKTSGGLNTSHDTSTKLNKRQRKTARKNKSDVEVYVGTNNPAGIQQEFGNVNHGPQPYARSAWESMKHGILKGISGDMSDEIFKTVARQEKKKAKG